MAIPTHSKRLAAWLGITAMLLLVCVPTVSRFLAVTHMLTLSVCAEATRSGRAPVAIQVPMGDRHDAPGKHRGSHILDDCGYCTLMTHDAALPSVPPALPAMLWLVVLVFVLPPVRRYIPIGAFPSRLPRAPPRFS